MINKVNRIYTDVLTSYRNNCIQQYQYTIISLSEERYTTIGIDWETFGGITVMLQATCKHKGHNKLSTTPASIGYF